jgi:hypothetical protein
VEKHAIGHASNAALPSADMNRRLPMSIAICPVPNEILTLQCGEEYHASYWGL